MLKPYCYEFQKATKLNNGAKNQNNSYCGEEGRRNSWNGHEGARWAQGC